MGQNVKVGLLLVVSKLEICQPSGGSSIPRTGPPSGRSVRRSRRWKASAFPRRYRVRAGRGRAGPRLRPRTCRRCEHGQCQGCGAPVPKGGQQSSCVSPLGENSILEPIPPTVPTCLTSTFGRRGQHSVLLDIGRMASKTDRAFASAPVSTNGHSWMWVPSLAPICPSRPGQAPILFHLELEA
jgi:hypothetical protein